MDRADGGCVLQIFYFKGIFSMRRWWRPASKSVLRKVFTISMAWSLVTKRPGMARKLASLWRRASDATSGIQHSAERMAWCLLSVMLMPSPLPHTAMPG